MTTNTENKWANKANSKNEWVREYFKAKIRYDEFNNLFMLLFKGIDTNASSKHAILFTAELERLKEIFDGFDDLYISRGWLCEDTCGDEDTWGEWTAEAVMEFETQLKVDKIALAIAREEYPVIPEDLRGFFPPDGAEFDAYFNSIQGRSSMMELNSIACAKDDIEYAMENINDWLKRNQDFTWDGDDTFCSNENGKKAEQLVDNVLDLWEQFIRSVKALAYA